MAGRLKYFVGLLVLSVAVSGVMGLITQRLAYGDWEPPPPPKPSRLSGGEGVPPLPLPATPLRRSEKKRPPAPPALIGKIQDGQPVWKTTDDGRKFSYLDWQSDTTDLYNLLNTANGKLGVRYRSIEVSLEDFSFNPAEIPILYMFGAPQVHVQRPNRRKAPLVPPRRWLPHRRCLLRRAALHGIVQGVVRPALPAAPAPPVAARSPHLPVLLPDREVHLPGTQQGRVSTECPNIYGIHLGCRCAVLLAPYDVSCGFAQHEHAWGYRVKAVPAQQFGVNLVSYVLANNELARFLSAEKVYYQEGEPTREEFVFGQIIHGGDWDPHPSGNMALLKYLGSQSTMEVQFKRANVNLRKPKHSTTRSST